MKNHDPTERRRRIRDLFERIAELPATERAAFLDDACDGDIDLRREVTTLRAEADSGDSPFKVLVNEMIWPALESLRTNPAHLEGWFDDLIASAPEEADLLIGKTISRFEILEPIGCGGMGIVYRAQDRTLGRTVALKFLPPSMSSDKAAKDRFIHEAKAASGFDHPNIATIHEIGETEEGQLFIAMGYYPGETLKERIARGPIPPAEALELSIQLVRGIAQAHALGVIHRDIKPGNLQVTTDGTVKLLDFGLAKLSYESGYTRLDQVLGTVAYMSPEQARGESVDHRTDLWAFGVVFYEMLIGRLPFKGGNTQTMIRAILEDVPVPPSASIREVPTALTLVLGHCLVKDPAHRYQSANELLEDLERAQEGLPPLRRGGREAWKRRWRRRWMAVAGPVVLAGAAIVLTILLKTQLLTSRPSDHPTFTRITEGPLVRDTGHFACIAWGDYDEDGNIDVAVADDAEGKPIRLYHNNGDGTFNRVDGAILATEPLAPYSLAWADQDNDGDLDLYAGTFQNAAIDAFYRNEGGGIFTKVTDGAWVNTPGASTSVAWGDYDSDGFVDLYVANFGTPHPERNFLYHNLGDGTMEMVQNATTAYEDTSGGALWTDYDDDGDLDLLVGGRTRAQFRNDGDGIFTLVPLNEGGIPWDIEGNGVFSAFSSANYDNDRDLDLFSTTWEAEPSNRLFYSEFGGRFFDVTEKVSAESGIRGLGSSWGDYDNDGYIDLYVSNHEGRNLLYHNEGGGSFRRVTEGPELLETSASCGCTWIDYDNDGDLDLMVSNGSWSEFEQTCELYRNEGNTNHWIVLTLKGSISNRAAIGAKVWAIVRTDGRNLSQLRELYGGGQGNSQPEPRAHFGLGDATIVDTLRIEWPSGIVQEFHDITADQFLTIEEVRTKAKLDVGEVAPVYGFLNRPSQYASAEGIAFDEAGNLYVTHRTFDGAAFVRNEVVRFTPEGKRSVRANLGPVEPHAFGALGLATDAPGNVYVAFDSGNAHHGVWKITPGGTREHLAGSERITAPDALTFDDRRNLYVTDCYPADRSDEIGLVWRYQGDGTPCEVWARSPLLAPDPVADPISPPPPNPPFAAPGANGIVFAPPDSLYVANTEKCQILRIPIRPDGSAGDVEVIAGRYPPVGPPSLLFAPDGLAIDAEGILYAAIPPAGFTGPDFPLSPVIRIDPATGTSEAVGEPLTVPSPFFDFTTSLAFGTGSWDHESLFVVGITARALDVAGGSGAKITQVRVGTR